MNIFFFLTVFFLFLEKMSSSVINDYISIRLETMATMYICKGINMAKTCKISHIYDDDDQHIIIIIHLFIHFVLQFSRHSFTHSFVHLCFHKIKIVFIIFFLFYFFNVTLNVYFVRVYVSVGVCIWKYVLVFINDYICKSCRCFSYCCCQESNGKGVSLKICVCV